MNAQDLLYTETHEWIEPEGEIVKVGISDHAQQMLGDIVFVEMPEVGQQLSAGDEMLTVESPKAAASVYAPVSGEVVEVNENLETGPEKINEDPFGEGWIVKLKPTNLEGEKAKLLNHDAYQKKVEEE